MVDSVASLLPSVTTASYRVATRLGANLYENVTVAEEVEGHLSLYDVAGTIAIFAPGEWCSLERING